jgi:hypothetical protein
MTPSEVRALEIALSGLTAEIKAMKDVIDRMHKNQDRLFKRLDDVEKQLATLQGEHNVRKDSCGTGTQSSGTWASVVRAAARSKVVSISFTTAATAGLVIIILLKCWGVI